MIHLQGFKIVFVTRMNTQTDAWMDARTEAQTDALQCTGAWSATDTLANCNKEKNGKI